MYVYCGQNWHGVGVTWNGGEARSYKMSSHTRGNNETEEKNSKETKKVLATFYTTVRHQKKI